MDRIWICNPAVFSLLSLLVGIRQRMARLSNRFLLMPRHSSRETGRRIFGSLVGYYYIITS